MGPGARGHFHCYVSYLAHHPEAVRWPLFVNHNKYVDIG